jgi:hypothetical protein
MTRERALLIAGCLALLVLVRPLRSGGRACIGPVAWLRWCALLVRSVLEASW